MKTPVKKALTRVRLHRVAGRIRRHLQQASRNMRRTDRRMAKHYLAEARCPKLHLGCGDHLLNGWLNSDLHPRSANVLRLDAAHPFPFRANTFAYVYSEHMIGALSLQSASVMLSECFRVLAPGGKVRITTPDLAFLIDLYGSQRSALQERYVEWVSAELTGKGSGFVINHFMRAWGHQFVYDKPTLCQALGSAGISNVMVCGLNESEDAALRNLANTGRLPDGFLQLESLTMEGSKLPGVQRKAIP